MTRPERQAFAVGRFVDLDASWLQDFTRACGIGGPGLGDAHPRRQRRRRCDHLSAAGVDVERGPGRRQPRSQQSGVPPRRSLFGGPLLKPAETPPRHIRCLSLAHQILERPHP